MNSTRRGLLGGLASASLLRRFADAQDAVPPIAAGPFRGTRESLHGYRAPDWFRDAKFGIWAHWGPQSAAEYGDWYARNMYMQGSKQYRYHVEKYGHPSKFGFKDIIPTWKAEKFDPEHLLDLYQKAGARYFVSMGVHHDNFDLWNSRHNRWNAVNMGPKRDIVGEFARAARKRGLRFGVSEHLAVSYHWFQTSHGADKDGPLAGVPYDGADPKYFDLYHETHEAPKSAWDQSTVPLRWKQHYFARIRDLLDHYEPDLLYTDGPIFFEEFGLGLTAHLYNLSARRHGGRTEAVYANKGKADCVNGTCVLDLERGIVDTIHDEPWQTDTCIGHWHYDKEAKYKSAKTVVDMLVDIVARNGNLLLNFPLPANGELDPQERTVLDGITRWMAVNGEAIYSTRPWSTFGSGPATTRTTAPPNASEHHAAEAFNENKRKELIAADVRYVRKGKSLYAFSMGTDAATAVFPELGTSSSEKPGKIGRVTLTGVPAQLKWKQEADALHVELPPQKPCEFGLSFRIDFA